MSSANPFYNKSFISVNQIKTKQKIQYLFKRADYMKDVVEGKKEYSPLREYSIGILFYQPSTRTFSSFVSASKRLGAYVVDIQGMKSYSSVAKGETLDDTVRSIYQTTGADAIVLRHPENTSSEIASKASSVPIINAGSGTLEHPTQALLDLYTIYNNFEDFNGLNVVMVGDLKYGRTIKSLAKVLGVIGKDINMTFVSPEELKAPKKLVNSLKESMDLTETEKLNSHLKNADVLYMTRVQKEWFEKEGKLDKYERLKDRYVLSKEMVESMKKDSIIMHPLPRVGEILKEVDEDYRANYFPQMRSGLYTRMALLESVLIEKP